MAGQANYRQPPYDALRVPMRVGQAGAQRPPQAVIFPPEVYPIPSAILFSVSTVAPGLAVSNAAAVVLATIAIPPQSKGVINVVEYGANTWTAGSVLS